MVKISSNDNLIEAKKLTKVFDSDFIAVDDVSFSVQAGKIYVMLGGNGAGKTTIINMFLNLIEPTEGEAYINGYVMHKEPILAKKYVSFVSENVMLYDNFSALQNMDFFAKISGKLHLTNNDYSKVLTRCGLKQNFHSMKLRKFSKGMRQKCGIAIAIIRDSKSILLDEPTSGLDPKSGYDFMRLLKTLRDEGKAILMSTHDIFRAKEIADIVGIMKEGRLIYEESVTQLDTLDLEQLYLQHFAGYTFE